MLAKPHLPTPRPRLAAPRRVRSTARRLVAPPLAAAALAISVHAGCTRPAAPVAAAPAPTGAPDAPVARAVVADTLGPGAWRPLPCASCERARVEIATRRSLRADGRAGRYALARVRNRNAHPVALVASFIPEYLEHGDGHVPAESWTLRLAAADSAGWEAVLTLRHPAPVRAAVRDVERF